MGTILIVKKNSTISIAADCCNTRDSSMRTSLNVSHGCILHIGESYIGLNSSVGFQQALEEILDDLSEGQIPPLNNRRSIRHFFSNVHETLKQRQAMYVNFQQGQEFEWSPMTALVANSSGIYKVDATRGVYQFTKFWALGTGEPYACGAMSAVYDRLDTSEEIAAAGLAAVRELEVDFDRKAEIFTIETPKTLLSVTPKIAARDGQSNKRVSKISRTPRPRNRSR